MSRQKREQLSTDLAADGITAADVLSMSAYLLSCLDDAGKAQRTLAAKLIAADRKVVVEDLRKHIAHIAAQGPKNSRDHDHGDRIRAENAERVRLFESQWAQFEADRKAGKLPPFEKAAMPWEPKR
jgi:hypothetical protein